MLVKVTSSVSVAVPTSNGKSPNRKSSRAHNYLTDYQYYRARNGLSFLVYRYKAKDNKALILPLKQNQLFGSHLFDIDDKFSYLLTTYNIFWE